MNQDQTTQAPQAPQENQQQIVLGFEKALTQMNPNWRTEFTKDQINAFRHFYHQGIQDIYFLVRLSNENMAANFNSILSSAITLGNEEELARIQAEATAAQAQEASEAQAKTATRGIKKAAPKKVAKRG